MIKVFTTNKDGKIELSKDELKNLLDEAYWDGYRANNNTFTYRSPCYTPYCWSTSSNHTVTLNTIDTGTINSNTVLSGQIKVDTSDPDCFVVHAEG